MNVVVAIHRQWRDARFIHEMKLKPTTLSRVFGPAADFEHRARRRLKSHYSDVKLKKYRPLHPQHYKVGGRGYSNLADLEQSVRQSRYENQMARFEFFAEAFGDVLDLQNGDSFLDLGCGTGQNIRHLSHEFPDSPIKGVDINKAAVELIRQFELSPRVRVHEADILNNYELDDLLNDRPDHILVSHVFSLLFESSVEDTTAWRRSFVHRLATSARKSVVVIDDFASRGHTVVQIEQLNRLVFLDDVLSYFMDTGSGRSFLAYSPHSQAILFQKSRG
mgnify:CR=1 FL=1